MRAAQNDCKLLAADYAACGGDATALDQKRNNLCACMGFERLPNRTTQADPSNLLGAVFIIEGVGQQLPMLGDTFAHIPLSKNSVEQIVATAQSTADLVRRQLDEASNPVAH